MYYGVLKLITGREREILELKKIEKRYFRKKFRLKSDFNRRILKGTLGTVMRIIDKKYVCVEFENHNVKPVKEGNKQVFKIDSKKLCSKEKNKRAAICKSIKTYFTQTVTH